MKTIVKKIKPDDILWFFTSKKYGGKIIGMAEYSHFYDRQDEPLIKMNTYTNIDQGWIGDDNWDIQIHYKNLYLTEKQSILICIQCAGNILNYETFRKKIEEYLSIHYKNFKFYAEPKKFN